MDQYCNPLADITVASISDQLEEITDKVKKMLRIKNPSHPSLRGVPGRFLFLHPACIRAGVSWSETCTTNTAMNAFTP